MEEMCFPDENYCYEGMEKSCTVIGAYDQGKCIGLAIMQEDFLRYMYLYDLKVRRARRIFSSTWISKEAFPGTWALGSGVFLC